MTSLKDFITPNERLNFRRSTAPLLVSILLALISIYFIGEIYVY